VNPGIAEGVSAVPHHEQQPRTIELFEEPLSGHRSTRPPQRALLLAAVGQEATGPRPASPPLFKVQRFRLHPAFVTPSPQVPAARRS
jgi:hypothetical protein